MHSHTCSRQRDKVNREHQVPINLLSNKATREQGGKICSIVVPHLPCPHLLCASMYRALFVSPKSEFYIIYIQNVPPFTMHPPLSCTPFTVYFCFPPRSPVDGALLYLAFRVQTCYRWLLDKALYNCNVFIT